MVRVVGSELAYVDGVIPLPLHPVMVWVRGCCQSLEIAFGLAEELNVPLDQEWVIRARNTRQQTQLNAEERQVNVRSAFFWRGVPPGRMWTLVDDVITTGATAYAFIDVFPGCVEHIVPTALARYEEGHS
jgi:predicted amidophosphoribosyltransferase